MQNERPCGRCDFPALSIIGITDLNPGLSEPPTKKQGGFSALGILDLIEVSKPDSSVPIQNNKDYCSKTFSFSLMVNACHHCCVVWLNPDWIALRTFQKIGRNDRSNSRDKFLSQQARNSLVLGSYQICLLRDQNDLFHEDRILCCWVLE